MNKSALVSLTVVVFAVPARAQQAPDDRYATQLSGKPLVEGTGFPGVVELGMPTPQMYKALGPGRETAGYPFWYFYDQGPWKLVVVAEPGANSEFTTRAIEISGASAPATKRGVHIGDPVARVTKIYGPGEAFTASVGSPMFAKPELEAPYKAGIYYPKLATLFVMKNGVVDRIVMLRAAAPRAAVTKIDRYDAS